MILLPAPSQDGPDKSKYCTYTEEHHVLKGLIKDILRSGKLAQFAEKKKKEKRTMKKFFKRVVNEKKDREPEHDREPLPTGSKQVIHVIFGGLEGGDSLDEQLG